RLPNTATPTAELSCNPSPQEPKTEQSPVTKEIAKKGSQRPFPSQIYSSISAILPSLIEAAIRSVCFQSPERCDASYHRNLLPLLSRKKKDRTFVRSFVNQLIPVMDPRSDRTSCQ